jgi:hypothetical protein
MEMGQYQASIHELYDLYHDPTLTENQRVTAKKQMMNVYYFFGLECIW